MSPVFRHGRLRLYLLKLLDEAPRHGYEVIRLLQDRFLGVYAPSPGTIYPRLARLEEEGLVTHDEVDGKKVYRITEKGREEIRGRLDDLTDLEEELAESVRDIAREVTQDVRETVRNLREELTWVARDVRREGRAASRGEKRGQDEERLAQDEERLAHEEDRRARQEERRARQEERRARQEERLAQDEEQLAQEEERLAQDEEHQAEEEDRQAEEEDRQAEEEDRQAEGTDRRVQDEARRVRDEARRARDDLRDRFRSQRGGRREWADWAAWQDWPGWAGRPDRPGGFGAAGDRGRSGGRERPGAGFRFGHGESGGPDPGLFRDLERIAIEFARELRSVAGHAEEVGESGLGDLRGILEDALARIRDEVFGGTQARPDDEQPERPDEPPAAGTPS